MYAFGVLMFLSCTNLIGIIVAEEPIQRIINLIFTIGLSAAAYQVWKLLP